PTPHETLRLGLDKGGYDRVKDTAAVKAAVSISTGVKRRQPRGRRPLAGGLPDGLIAATGLRRPRARRTDRSCTPAADPAGHLPASIPTRPSSPWRLRARSYDAGPGPRSR